MCVRPATDVYILFVAPNKIHIFIGIKQKYQYYKLFYYLGYIITISTATHSRKDVKIPVKAQICYLKKKSPKRYLKSRFSYCVSVGLRCGLQLVEDKSAVKSRPL